jgi:hypothetical protein
MVPITSREYLNQQFSGVPVAAFSAGSDREGG